MKIIKYLSVIAASAALICSCNDLEQPPTNQYTDANFWSPERAEYMVNTAYSQMYSIDKLINDECLSDNIAATRNDGSFEVRKGSALPTSGRFSGEWSDAYGGIKSCHVFLDNIDAQDIPEEEKDLMKAQVRFIRAFLYFRLTNFYGDVPFFTKDITLEESKTIARTPRAEVIQFIHDEMAAIIPVLPTNLEEQTGRITKGAAAMLDARAYLYDSDWANTAAVCKKIMDGEYGTYKLHPSYKALFSETEEYSADYNAEVILTRGYVAQLYTWSYGGDMQDMYPVAVQGRTPDILPLQSLADNYLMLNGYAINEAGSGFNPADPYKDRDPRMTHTIFYDGYDLATELAEFKDAGFFNNDRVIFEGGFYQALNPDAKATDTHVEEENTYNRTGYGMRKWYAPQAPMDWNSGLNAVIMRYADVLLMYAEAMYEDGKMTSDVWDATIKPIRERAGFTAAKALDYPTSGDLREIIRNERRSELALEGLRYYDIMRWKEGEKYLSGTIGGATFTTWTDTYNFNKNRDYLWPVPENQSNLNPNLGQNPGWGTSN